VLFLVSPNFLAKKNQFLRWGLVFLLFYQRRLCLSYTCRDPHVGVEVCMRAFRKVPLEMRERMASFTDGKTRLIGGSADTVYIPGRHRQKFMETLGLFLETDCFLEIATPTAVHLTVPPNEPILFVDHVRPHLTPLIC
jgi:hypothetical protein